MGDSLSYLDNLLAQDNENQVYNNQTRGGYFDGSLLNMHLQFL